MAAVEKIRQAFLVVELHNGDEYMFHTTDSGAEVGSETVEDSDHDTEYGMGPEYEWLRDPPKHTMFVRNMREYTMYAPENPKPSKALGFMRRLMGGG